MINIHFWTWTEPKWSTTDTTWHLCGGGGSERARSTQRRGEGWPTWRSPAAKAASCGWSGHLSMTSTMASKRSQKSGRCHQRCYVVLHQCANARHKQGERKEYSVGVIIMKFMYFNFVWLLWQRALPQSMWARVTAQMGPSYSTYLQKPNTVSEKLNPNDLVDFNWNGRYELNQIILKAFLLKW